MNRAAREEWKRVSIAESNSPWRAETRAAEVRLRAGNIPPWNADELDEVVAKKGMVMGVHRTAAEWARHFGQLESDMDRLLGKMLGLSEQETAKWMQPGRYVSGTEFAERGLAELVDLTSLRGFESNGAPRSRRKVRG